MHDSVDGDGSSLATIMDCIGTRFAWREVAPAEATETIVLLHGLGGSRTSWDAQLVGLSSPATGERFRVVAWDLPGYGDSTAMSGPIGFAVLADAVAAFVIELGCRHVHLVGISMGGMIAQYTAALHGEIVSTLTLLATSPKFGLDGTRPVDWKAARLAPLEAGVTPADMAHGVLASLAGPNISPSALAGQVAAMARISAEALRTCLDVIVTHDSRPLLPTIEAPTLCLVGADDAETPPTYAMAVADLIRGAQLSVIEGAGHLLNAEAPELVNEAILDHIHRSRQHNERSNS